MARAAAVESICDRLAFLRVKLRSRGLVEAVGVRKWREEYGQRFQYWGPEAFDVEGRLVYRYDFPRPSRRIALAAHVSCPAQSLEKGIIGNGAGAIEYSRDGHDWRSLGNTIEPRRWGESVTYEGLLPADACGGTSLWLRVRLLSSGAWKRADYALAQFLRCRPDDAARLFELDVECEPEEGGSAAAPLTD